MVQVGSGGEGLFVFHKVGWDRVPANGSDGVAQSMVLRSEGVGKPWHAQWQAQVIRLCGQGKVLEKVVMRCWGHYYER